MKQFFRKLTFIFAGLFLWIVLRVPFREAMAAAKETEEITRDM